MSQAPPSAPIPLPSHAYVPGRTPRHPEGRFDALRATAMPGMTPQALAVSPAFCAGLLYLDQGYFWESHEVLEPVWLALPQGTAERHLVQALIQLANARLKARMDRPRAVARLGAIVARHLADCRAAGGGPVVMGQVLSDMQDQAERLAESGLKGA
ncbi:MAG: DUF309 domain-containing protein [Pararhodobacter sp.]|nr:DUF309 domain-containing protein [Pararhodobacter sp.]